MAELAELIQITEGRKVKRITKQRALIKALTAGGIKGNTRAANLLISLSARLIEGDPEGQARAELDAKDRKIVEDYLERQGAAARQAKRGRMMDTASLLGAALAGTSLRLHRRRSKSSTLEPCSWTTGT